MVYAYDRGAQLPVMDIYDTGMMQLAINAAKDMYEKGQQEMKDFSKEYGDFISPFAKDMERYGEMVGGVRDTLDKLYAAGIDPLRSAEGRAIISRLSRSINPAEFNMMRSNAKTGYAYLDAMQKLRSQGKYSEAQELFDIAQNNGINFSDFSTRGEGGLRTWDRTSPIEAVSLRDLTANNYAGRTARLLSEADFNDPRLAGKYKYDPNYEWSGYLYSDLLKGAPGASLSLAGDPRAAFFRNQAEQKVAASGRPYTQADVEAQFQRDIADANTWALIDPTRTPNQFAVSDYNFKHQWDLQKDSQQFQKDMAEQAAKDKLDQIKARYGDKTANNGKDNPSNQNYSLTESIHHDLLFQGIRNNNIPVMKLTTDSKGNVVPQKDKDGKIIYINPDQASWNELEYAANSSNIYLRRQQDFFNTNSTKYANNPEKVERMIKDRFGSRITGIQLASMLKRQIQRDGAIVLSSGEAKLLRGTKGITSDGIGSNYNLTYNDRLAEVYDEVKAAINSEDIVGDVQIKFNLTDTGNNAVQIAEKYNKGRTEIYANGTVTVTGKNKEGKPITKEVTTNAWLPLGLNSEIAAGNNTNVRSNVALASNNQSAYSSIDANYMKTMGQQQKANIGLFANSELPMIIDWDNLDVEDYLELLQNNNP